MAIYHLSAKVIGRSTGRSVTAAAAYRAAERIADDRTGVVHDYSRKGAVEHREILMPNNAPAWMADREKLWNAVEKVEARKDAQLAREIEVALPRELDSSQRLELVRGFVKEEFVSRGMVADVAVHNPRPDGQEHPHAHVLLTMRCLTDGGFGPKQREWNAKDVLEGWRERWAERVNHELERVGRSERIDHRTLEAQREEALGRAADAQRPEPERVVALKEVIALDREPQPKVGTTATALERRGIATERGDELRATAVRNAERAALWERLESVREALTELRERATEALARGVDAARDMLHAAKERVVGWREGPAAKPSPEPPRHERAALLGQGETARAPPAAPDRDALLGRSQPANSREVPQPDRDALLGRQPPAERSGQAPSRDDLLGRGPARKSDSPRIPGRDQGDRDR
ncbi:MAG: MobQ family relaxase [Rhodospirillaceae bacterium]